MEITFDISEDELPVFLAEADEHLQALDDSLIRLEREDADADLVQTVFRSAHTIKGMSGMIGHKRMTALTHALETVLDGVRKNSIQITKPMINICLEAVDHLRLLRDEIVTAQICDLNVDETVKSLKDFIEGTKQEPVQPVPDTGHEKNTARTVPENGNQPSQKVEPANSIGSGAEQ